MAQPTQACQMLSFSEEMEVRVVIGEDFAPRALLQRVSFQDLVRRGGLGWCVQEKRHACESQEAGASCNGRRVAKADFARVGPVVWARAQGHCCPSQTTF
jgi:hypothetical protein